jgi:NAD(P)-dependent dehydrogenase (short-subunit alcohol dehydrogenase family)
MPLYRAAPENGIAWITGASTGIGRQLSIDLAKAGYTVAATARSVDKLDALAVETAGVKGKIVGFPCDLTDHTAVQKVVDEIERGLGPIVLAIFNAGNYFPARGEKLALDNFRKTYEINLFGVVNGLVPVVEHMKIRRKGQLAIVSSASAYGGLPLASAYGASKAALVNMAEALKFDFDKLNIRIQIITPGFVETPLTEGNKFKMPALMPVEAAAQRIEQGLKSGGFEITFPRRFTWWLKFVNLLPYPAYFAILNRFMGWKSRPLKF